jgi:hypothetical protein
MYFIQCEILLLYNDCNKTDGMNNVKKKFPHRMISGFRRDADEIFALLGYKATSSGNPLPTFRDNLSVPSSRIKKSLEYWSDTLFRNVDEILPFDAS